ncbi:MAG: hypothetical protein K2U26_05510 [Cyclobacteriaceae bacterium]|nr:hypothetical protein [Cyclobacteriaceae bacterium]
MAQEYVLLFTGHLLDAADRADERFPHHSLDDARKLLAAYIDQALQTQSYTLAISSLAAGADMLFAAEMIRRKIALVVFIPFEKETFIAESVNYLKGQADENPDAWRAEFERILSSAREVKYLHPAQPGPAAYTYCNDEMLAYAINHGNATLCQVTAMALMRPHETKVEGGAAHFVEKIKKKNIPVQVIWPDDTLAQLSDIKKIELLVPLFGTLDAHATRFQSRWRKRLKMTLIILATVAFFDAFVTVPDHFLMGNGQIVRMVSLVISAAGAFLTLQLQLSDKTSLSQWTNSRAKAEQIRSEIWFYLFNYWSENNRFGPYTESEFESYTQRLAPEAWQGELINTSKLIGLKQKIIFFSISEKINYYRIHRLDDQLAYFKKKKQYFTHRIRIYKTLTLLFLSVSIVWGICKMIGEFNPSFGFFMDMSPLGMMISFIALVASYAEANNSKEMEYKYEQMGGGLAQLIDTGKSVQYQADFDRWVKECETFLRTQNNEWSLKREK